MRKQKAGGVSSPTVREGVMRKQRAEGVSSPTVREGVVRDSNFRFGIADWQMTNVK